MLYAPAPFCNFLFPVFLATTLIRFFLSFLLFFFNGLLFLSLLALGPLLCSFSVNFLIHSLDLKLCNENSQICVSSSHFSPKIQASLPGYLLESSDWAEQRHLKHSVSKIEHAIISPSLWRNAYAYAFYLLMISPEPPFSINVICFLPCNADCGLLF